MRDIFVDKIFSDMKNNPSVLLLTADLGFGIFDKFEEFRDSQYFNVGVCEQLMASMSAGLASEGFKVFIYSIGVFPTMRCLEQIRNDISYHEYDVTIVTSGAGFSYGALGMSHHCVQDIGIMSSIPGVNIFSPANNYEMSLTLESYSKLKYIRIDKSEFDINPITEVNNISQPICYFKSQKKERDLCTLILSHGSIASIALPILNSQFNVDLYSLAHIYESPELIDLLRNYKKLIVIEEHSENNGFSTFISFIMSKNNIHLDFKFIALPHNHCSLVGDQAFLRESSEINTNKLIRLLENNS